MNKIEKVSLEIKKRREELGLYQEEVVEKLKKEGVDISISALSRIEAKERQKLDTSFLIALSKILKKDFIAMLGYEMENKKTNTKELINDIPEIITLPVYGMASAGNGSLDFDVAMEEFMLPSDFKIPKNSFVIGVQGESMEPIFYDEDRILVDTSKIQEWQYLVDYPVVVQINEERFLKLVKFKDYKPEFHSLNKMYEPIKITNGDEIYCVGVVTEILKRKIGKIKI